MRCLLDTATLFRLDQEPGRVSDRAWEIVDDPNVECLFSVISAWEFEVKASIGKLRFDQSVRESTEQLIERFGLTVLGLDLNAVHQHVGLPMLHKDPFDRLLLCQCLAERVPVVTPDRAFLQYSVQVIW